MATISAPTTLATFSTSHASSSKHRHVALAEVTGSAGAQAVAAVQGDGVWTYDLRTLRPITAFTVPPSTIFTTRPLSFVPMGDEPASAVRSKGKGKADPVDDGMEVETSSIGSAPPAIEVSRRITAVGVTVRSSGKQKRSSGSVWIWRGEDGAEKNVVEVPSVLHDLHHLNLTNLPILLVYHDGSVAALDHTDSLIHLLPATQPSLNLISSRTIPSGQAATGLVIVGSTGRVITVRIDHPAEGLCAARVVSDKSPIERSVAIASADLTEKGAVLGIDSSRHLLSADTIAGAAAAASSAKVRGSPSPAVLALPGQRPLLLFATAEPEPSLLVALVSSSIPAVLGIAEISSLTTDCAVTEIACLGLSSPHASTVGLVVWHKHAEGDAGRSVVHVCEVTVPERSWGMSALLGSKSRTSRFFDMEPAAMSVGNGPKLNGDAAASSASTDGRDVEKLLESPITESSWEALTEVVRTDRTLPSAVIVRVIRTSIPEQRVGQIYEILLGLPPPSTDFRVEFRRLISVDEATKVLSYLCDRISEWSERQTEGLSWPTPSASTTDRAPASLSSPSNPPNLESLLAHISLLLDSHLSLFLDHSPSHSLLERLSAVLAPILALQGEIRKLQAPLDALLVLANREEKRKADLRAKREAARQASSIERQSDKSAAKAAVTRRNRGLDQVAEGQSVMPGGEVGKWRVEDFAF